MDIRVVKFEKDNFVRFVVGSREEQANLIDYDVTEGSRRSLETIFFPYQVKHIAETLKEKMIEMDSKKKPEELPPIEFEYSLDRNEFNPSGSKYLRNIKLTEDKKTDVYAVLLAFEVTCPARQHAIKKLLCAGLRGKNDVTNDLKEARDAIERAIELIL